MMLNDVTFANPGFFYLFLLLPLLILYYVIKGKGQAPKLTYSALSNFAAARPTLKQRLIHLPFILRLITLSLIIVILARPQSTTSFRDIKTEGIDIVLAMDISASMLAKDLVPDRLSASKRVAMEFIDQRPNDRIGLVIFSGESFTQCPLTTDHAVLKNLFASVKTGMVQDGTAIGMGLSTAIGRLENSKAKSKVIILLTDGVNNAGSIAPTTAAELAVPFGIRVYTIAVGTYGKAYTPVGIYPDGTYAFDYADVKIDENVMKEISRMTNGKYFRATNNDKLKEIYAEIDKLEKTIIQEKKYTKREELFFPLALAAVGMLFLEFLLGKTLLKTLF